MVTLLLFEAFNEIRLRVNIFPDRREHHDGWSLIAADIHGFPEVPAPDAQVRRIHAAWANARRRPERQISQAAPCFVYIYSMNQLT